MDHDVKAALAAVDPTNGASVAAEPDRRPTDDADTRLGHNRPPFMNARPGCRAHTGVFRDASGDRGGSFATRHPNAHHDHRPSA